MSGHTDEVRDPDGREATRDPGVAPGVVLSPTLPLGLAVCAGCGEPMVRRRHGPQPKTCSARCRKRVHRRVLAATAPARCPEPSPLPVTPFEQSRVEDLRRTLRDARIDAELSQYGLSDRSGIPRGTIAHVEQGLTLSLPFAELVGWLLACGWGLYVARVPEGER